jgi:hypothetical protein
MVVISTLIALTAYSIASVTSQTAPPAPDFWGGFVQQARSSVQAMPSQFQDYWKNFKILAPTLAVKPLKLLNRLALKLQLMPAILALKLRKVL